MRSGGIIQDGLYDSKKMTCCWYNTDVIQILPEKIAEIELLHIIIVLKENKSQIFFL
jgi:hypothetical protein